MGGPSSMQSNKFLFQIRKCDNTIDQNCADPAEINEFIKKKGIMVETWVVHQKIDWGIYGELPTFFTVEMKNAVMLDPLIM